MWHLNRFPRRQWRRLSLLALALLPPGLCAQQDEAAFLSELPVVLSATRLKQSRHDTPAAVTVIDRHMIQASGARTLVDVLRLVPGMVTGFATGNHQVVSYHGMADEFSRRMQVLVDGRSVYQPDFGGVSWSSLPLALEDIDRIEVIRGPNSVTYGTNSFLGVISILTRHAAEEQGTYTKLTRGSDDIGDALLRHGGRQGALDYRLSFQYQQDGGFDGVTRYKSRIWDNHDWSRARRLTGRADYQASATDRWEFQAGIAESPQGKGALFSDLSDPPRTQHKENNFVQLRWERSNTTGHEFHVQFHRDEHVTRDLILVGPVTSDLDAATVNKLTGIPLPGILTASALLDGYLRTQRHDLEFQHRYSPAQGARFVWGGSLRMDRVRSEGWFGRDDWLYHHLYRVFGNAEIPVTQDLKFNMGAMLEHNDIIGHDLSPRLALNYRLAEQHSLRTAWSLASRTPAMIEEVGNLVGNIDAELTIPGVGSQDFTVAEQLILSSGGLPRERIESVELGYFGEFFERRLQLDVKVFYDEVDKLITLTTTQNKPIALLSNNLIDFETTDRARLQGIETQLDWRPSTHTMVRFGHAYVDIDSDDVQEEYSQSAPRNSYLLFASHRFPRQLDASLAWHYTERMQWLEWESINAISRLDLRFAKGFRLGKQKAQLALVGQNILGDHLEFRRGNRFDPRVFIQFSLASD
ncbi:MAG TPA: TonB-dependent receptor [Gammaproteobacteria bacterium]|nr:TonB-dependent receptor [Gammaproteobacteria bacterium]